MSNSQPCKKGKRHVQQGNAAPWSGAWAVPVGWRSRRHSSPTQAGSNVSSSSPVFSPNIHLKISFLTHPLHTWGRSLYERRNDSTESWEMWGLVQQKWVGDFRPTLSSAWGNLLLVLSIKAVSFSPSWLDLHVHPCFGLGQSAEQQCSPALILT